MFYLNLSIAEGGVQTLVHVHLVCKPELATVIVSMERLLCHAM